MHVKKRGTTPPEYNRIQCTHGDLVWNKLDVGQRVPPYVCVNQGVQEVDSLVFLKPGERFSQHQNLVWVHQKRDTNYRRYPTTS